VSKLGSTASWSLNYIESLVGDAQLTKKDSGKRLMLNSASGLTVTLPSVAEAGVSWNCQVIIGTNCTSNSYIITEKTTVDTDVIVSQINELETDTGDDGPSNTGHTTLTMGNATDQKGDFFNIFCDGTNFYVYGQTALDGGCVLA